MSRVQRLAVGKRGRPFKGTQGALDPQKRLDLLEQELKQLIEELHFLINPWELSPIVKAGPYTAHAFEIVRFDPTAGAFEILLPDPATIPGARIKFKNVSASANTLTIRTIVANIDGSATTTLAAARGVKELLATSGGYLVV